MEFALFEQGYAGAEEGFALFAPTGKGGGDAVVFEEGKIVLTVGEKRVGDGQAADLDVLAAEVDFEAGQFKVGVAVEHADVRAGEGRVAQVLAGKLAV